MINEIKSEFLKEKRSANARLLVIVPIVFIIFNVLLVGLMGRSPAGRSYLMATAFNWYPLLVLPVVLSILVININNKEKEEHIAFRKSHGFKYGSSIVAKNVVVMSEILCIILLSSVFVYVFGVYVMKDDISIGELIKASAVLFTGSLAVVGISFMLYGVFRRKFIVVIVNFIMTFISPVIAVKSTWYLYPWDYSLRMLAPVIKVLPNGLFIEGPSVFLNMNNLYMGAGLSVVLYSLCIIASCKRGERND